MRWLNPAQDTSEQKDRRVVVDTEGRSKSHRLIIEMTDNGWVVQEQDQEELSDQHREAAEAKLLPHYRKAWEYIRKRWYESNQTAQVTASELRGLSGFDYDQKCRDCMKALEKAGLIVQDGSCATSTGRGRQFLYIPAEGASELIVNMKKTTFLPFSPVSCEASHEEPRKETMEKEEKASFPSAHVNTRWNPSRYLEVERFANNRWNNGWVVIDETNPDAVVISGKGSQKDTVPSYLLRSCKPKPKPEPEEIPFDPAQLDLSSLPF
jgi:primase-polymerase (primpol)-like protein